MNIKNEILEYVKMIIIVVLAVLLIDEVILINAKIPSASMENTIMTKDRIFGLRLAYGINLDFFGKDILTVKMRDPERFDIVIFRYPDDEKQLYIKRIIGLPGESCEDICASVRYVCEKKTDGLKLQLLHVLKGTDLEKEYRQGKIHVLSEEEYMDILKACVSLIPDDVVIHRLTGDGDKKLLAAPLWSADKKHVLNRIRREVLIS